MIVISVIAGWGFIREAPPRDEKRLQSKNPDILFTEQGETSFRIDRNECFLVIEADNLFTSQAISAIRRVVSELEKLRVVHRVLWLEDVPVLNMFGIPQPLLPSADADPKAFAESRRQILAHPLVFGQLISPDGKTLLLPINFNWSYVYSDADCTSGILEVARRAAAATPDGNLQIRITGQVPLFVAAREAFNANHRKFQIIGYVLVFVLSAFLFRGIVTVLIVATAPALAIFWTHGLLELLAVTRNDLTTVVLPVLITMVGLTDGVHLMVFIRRRRAEGDAPGSAVYAAILQVGTACLLTSLTTAIGFASLLLARSEPIRDFGLSCSLGVLITFLAVISVIPIACATRLGLFVQKGYEHDLVGRKLKRLNGLLDWILQHSRTVSLFGGLLTIICAAISLSLRPDARTLNALPSRSAATEALVHCNEAFGGIEFVRIVLQWPQTLPGDSPEILKVIQEIEQSIAREPLLRHPLSIRNLLAAISNADAPNRLSFLELLPRAVRDPLYDRKQHKTLILMRVQDLGVAAYQPVFARLRTELKRLEKKHVGFEMELTGGAVSAGNDLAQIVYDLVASLGTASLIILLVMTLFYRSWRIGLVTVIPNLLPLAATGTLLVLTGQNLAIVSVCALAVCIGIAVDDSIHFLTRFRQELSKCEQVDRAIRNTFIGVGTALVITTLILLTGFATVLISPLPTHRMFSMMACATIGGALIADLIFLPALLRWLIRSPADIPTKSFPSDAITNEPSVDLDPLGKPRHTL